MMSENTLIDICRKSMWNNIEIFKRYVPLPNIIGILNDILSKLKTPTLPSDTAMTECTGCLENQPNQQAHMDYGGCLYDENV